MKLRALMKRYPLTIAADETIGIAIQTMLWHGIRHLPVLDEQRLVGVVSNHDLAWYRARVGANANAQSVREAMHADPRTAGPDESLTEAAARMAEHRIGCLPIVENGMLVSMVTTTDILSTEARQSLGGAPTGTTATDIMTTDPATAHPDDTLLVAAARMQRLNVRHLPIVDANHRVIGMLSDRDLRTVIGNAFLDPDQQSPAGALAERRVGDVMSRDVLTVTPGQSVAELAAELMGRAISALPVVDDDGRLVGIVSIVDVLRGLAPATA